MNVKYFIPVFGLIYGVIYPPKEVDGVKIYGWALYQLSITALVGIWIFKLIAE